jgi:hypothetical protein
LITTTSSATRKTLEKQLDQALLRQTDLNLKIDNLNNQLFDYETQIVEIKTNNDLAGELGPLKYLSNLTGVSMDKIINWLLLTIIFVFDPLAIALVIAANFAFEQSKNKNDMKLFNWFKKKQEEPIIQDEIQVEEFQPLDLEVEQILEQEEVVEEKHTDSLVEAVNEYLEAKKEEPVLNRRDLKIKHKFNREDNDLTIKY